jgi:predicted RNA-binding Zn-ribbon protein involved in translation (DUF1610 family)
MSTPYLASAVELLPTSELPPTGSSPAASITCPSCGVQLPIRPSAWMELPALWRCVSCGAHHCGVLPRDARDHVLPVVALAAQYFACEPPLLEHESVDALLDVLRQHEAHTMVQEQRTSPRVARHLHAQVVAVDESWAPRGKSFPVVVYNISTGGLAYVTTTVHRSPLAAIQLAAGRTLQVIAQSVWAHPEFDGLFSVGVRFLCRLGTGSTS